MLSGAAQALEQRDGVDVAARDSAAPASAIAVAATRLEHSARESEKLPARA